EHGRGLALVEAALPLVDAADRRASLLFCRANLLGYVSPERELAALLEAERACAEPSETRAWLLWRLSAKYLVFGDPEACARYADRARELASAVGARECLAALTVTLAAADARRGDTSALLAAVASEHSGRTLVVLYNHLTHAYLSSGHDAEAEQAGVDGLAVAERDGLVRSTALPCAVNLAEALFWQCRWDAARDRLDRTQDLLEGPALRTQLTIWRGQLLLATGQGERPDLADVQYETGPPQTVVPLAEQAIEFALLDGDEALAREVFRRILAQPGFRREPSHAWPLLLAAAKT
ncbi:hypothetical protein, partial [Actinocorallia lasiicapitis]